MFDPADHRIRNAAFEWLGHQIELHGDVLSARVLRGGFDLDGERIHVISPAAGIFKPKQLPEQPLSIFTSPEDPYGDATMSPEGLMLYRYQGANPDRFDNQWLRLAKKRRTPLIYFYGLSPGKYVPAFPVFIVGDDRAGRTFTVAIDDASTQRGDLGAQIDALAVHDAEAESRRIYVTGVFRRRVHQRSFRERVLRAYRAQCALCRLRHEELLDAAHIVPDTEEGPPVVRNGLALCKLHHAAFDRHFIGIRPDMIVEVRADVLDEHDGPMLRHGLQGMNLQAIAKPRSRDDWPDPGFLLRRYERFRSAVR